MKIDDDKYKSAMAAAIDGATKIKDACGDFLYAPRVVTREQFVAVQATLACFFNVSSDENGGCDGEPSVADFLREQNPDAHPSYVAEKCQVWRRSPIAFFGSLDHERAVKFIQWSVTRFGRDASRRWDANEGNGP